MTEATRSQDQAGSICSDATHQETLSQKLDALSADIEALNKGVESKHFLTYKTDLQILRNLREQMDGIRNGSATGDKL